MPTDVGSGFRCSNCGKHITVFAPALPVLPDPMKLTCPFCGHVDNYAKDSVRNVFNYSDE